MFRNRSVETSTAKNEKSSHEPTCFRRMLAHSMAFIARILEGVSSGRSTPMGVTGRKGVRRARGVHMADMVVAIASGNNALAFLFDGLFDETNMFTRAEYITAKRSLSAVVSRRNP